MFSMEVCQQVHPGHVQHGSLLASTPWRCSARKFASKFSTNVSPSSVKPCHECFTFKAHAKYCFFSWLIWQADAFLFTSDQWQIEISTQLVFQSDFNQFIFWWIYTWSSSYWMTSNNFDVCWQGNNPKLRVRRLGVHRLQCWTLAPIETKSIYSNWRVLTVASWGPICPRLA